MGRKTQLNLYIDGQIVELARLKFYGKLSNYVESYLRTLLEMEEVEDIVKNERKILNDLTQQESEIKRKRKIIQERRKLHNQREADVELEQIRLRAQMMKRDNPARWD